MGNLGLDCLRSCDFRRDKTGKVKEVFSDRSLLDFKAVTIATGQNLTQTQRHGSVCFLTLRRDIHETLRGHGATVYCVWFSCC
jgi:hypothetical protein